MEYILKIIQKIAAEYPNFPMLWIILSFFLVFIVYSYVRGHFNYILNLKNQKKSSLLDLIRKLNDIEINSDLTKQSILESMTHNLFQLEKGFKINIEKREPLITFYSEHQKYISWDKIKQAISYLDLNEAQEIFVKLTFSDRFVYYMFIIFEVLMAGGWVFTYLFMLIRDPRDPFILLMLLIVMPVLLLISVFAIPINKIYAAKFIMKKIGENITPD